MNIRIPQELTDSSRECKTELALSIAAGGIAVEGATDLDPTHEIMEFVLGHPIWTHELADKRIWQEAAKKVFLQIPALCELGHKLREDRDHHAKIRQEALDMLGPFVTLVRGDNERTESPIDSALRMFGEDRVIAI